MLTDLAEALIDCDEDEVLRLVQARIDAQSSVSDIIAECNAGMSELGDRFESGDAFIPDLMFAGMIMKKVTETLAPLVQDADKNENQKTIIIGTVKNDIHDIGKNLTAMVFQGAGFKVIDLGVDVPSEKFVEAIREYHPDFVAMSLLLTTCYQSVADTMDAIRNAGLRDQVTVCLGGAAANQALADKTGCDFYGATAVETLRWASVK